MRPPGWIPVVIRRLMANMEASGLVRSLAGRNGGFELERDAADITLADVYRAVEDETIFRMHRVAPNASCPVACQIGRILADPLRAAEGALAKSLAKTTLKDVASSIA